MDKSSTMSREFKTFDFYKGDDEPTASGWLKVQQYAEVRNRTDTSHSFPYMAIVWRLVNRDSERRGHQRLEFSWWLQERGSGTRSLDSIGSSRRFGWPSVGDGLLPGFPVGLHRRPWVSTMENRSGVGCLKFPVSFLILADRTPA
jgi:hypothetical protein